MSKQVHNRGMFDYMTETGPFQSRVVKKVIFCFAFGNYIHEVCHLLHLIATNNKSNFKPT